MKCLPDVPTPHGTFEAAIAHSDANTQEVARAARKLIIEMMPHVVEVPWPKQHNVGYGTGVKKKSEHFCHITAYARHVNLGFDYGTELADPRGLLEGTGKMYRHVKLRTIDDVRNPAVRHLLALATRHRMPRRDSKTK